MSRVYFGTELEGVATFWRLLRQDGGALGFTSHDRALTFGGLVYRAAPGMIPSAIRRTASLDLDSAEVQGALSHDAISSAELMAGKYDGAKVVIGVVDWETLENAELYHGEIGEISADAGGFEAELRSAKANLELDTVPRTSPTCRARFCGPGCGLSAHRFTHEAIVIAADEGTNTVEFGGVDAAAMLDGSLRWIDGPHAGSEMLVIQAGSDGLLLDHDIGPLITPDLRALLREGCDHTLGTCHSRFDNAVNFQGEPFLPGNDSLVRYPVSSS